ncbi:MAG: AI-2E family transporter [Paludibacter sp.]|jgi:predicted PurR-regulated permease PerM|nr:AI-2E family transporter [Paludibacter sp.]
MDNPKPYTFDRVVRLLIAVAVLVALALLIRQLSGVLLPFAVAWVMAYLFHPIVVFFQKKLKIRNRILALVASLLSFIIMFAGILFLIIPLINNEIEKFSNLIALYTENFTVVPFIPAEWQTALYNFFSGIDVQKLLTDDSVKDIAQTILPKIVGILNSSLSFLLGLFMVFIVFLYFIFILLDYEKINNGFISAIPLKYRTLVSEIITDIKRAMNLYFRGQVLIALIVGILFAIGFSIAGLPLAIVVGLFMGFLNLVPYMQTIGFVPVIFLAFLKSLETGQSFWMLLLGVAIVAVVVQVFQDMFLVPKIMGKNMGLNPAIILLSLSVWGALLGLLGLIIALPLTTLLISYYRRFVLKSPY